MVDFFFALKLAGAGDDFRDKKRASWKADADWLINKASCKQYWNKSQLAKPNFARPLTSLSHPKEKRIGSRRYFLVASALQKTGNLKYGNLFNPIWTTPQVCSNIYHKTANAKQILV